MKTWAVSRVPLTADDYVVKLPDDAVPFQVELPHNLTNSSDRVIMSCPGVVYFIAPITDEQLAKLKKERKKR